ncbi:MAG: hypothetical protein J7604_08835 [Sporocytophaga sp.]|uniref:hypothetical protein n=1 Tax=Sporocytophaga sp. TaxID=2231183 RepID=UPI001B00E287|nr:hypothetical protein [Sporocytophaga sp.]MBO9700303.1 hypothetical protein [Sporocytophaga sp.]
MKKINIVTSVIGFAFIGGIYLSGCEEKKTEAGHADTATSMYSQQEKKETSKAEMEEEKEKLENKIEALEKKADEKADKGSKVVKQKFTVLKKQVKDYNFDSTKVDAEEGWTRFKLRIETAVDSLEKKI